MVQLTKLESMVLEIIKAARETSKTAPGSGQILSELQKQGVEGLDKKRVDGLIGRLFDKGYLVISDNLPPTP